MTKESSFLHDFIDLPPIRFPVPLIDRWEWMKFVRVNLTLSYSTEPKFLLYEKRTPSTPFFITSSSLNWSGKTKRKKDNMRTIRKQRSRTHITHELSQCGAHQGSLKILFTDKENDRLHGKIWSRPLVQTCCHFSFRNQRNILLPLSP